MRHIDAASICLAIGVTFFLLVVHLQQVVGCSPLQAGLAMLPVTVLTSGILNSEFRSLCARSYQQAGMARFRRVFRRLGAAAVVAAAASWSASHVHAQAVAASAPPAATDPIERVTVDLAAAAFDRVLPFDVPFFVVGAAPEGAVGLEAQYVEVPSSGVDPAAPFKPTVPAAWRPDAPATGGQPFVVFFREPLEADRYYRFRFVFLKQPPAAQIDEIRTLASGRFDEALKAVRAGSLPLPDAARIRGELADIVRGIAGPAEWRIADGSFFDTRVESPASVVRFLEEAEPVLSAQLEREAVLQSLAEVQLRLGRSLESVRTHPALQQLAVAAATIDDPGLNALREIDGDGLALLRMTAEETALAAVGGVRGDLDDFWRSSAVTSRLRGLEQTRRQLQQLGHFIQAVAPPQAAARPLVEPVAGVEVLSQVATLIDPTGLVTATIDLAQRALAELTRMADALGARDQGLARLADLVALFLLDERFAEATTVATGQTAQNNYVSADAGFLYAGDIGTAAMYIGSNIYFRPVNKRAPLSLVSSFGRRFAVTLGMTVSSIADENERTRTDLFANQSLVIGAGYRFTQSIRGGAGAIVFRESDPNPLISRKNAATTWYVSFSFDLDVARTFARVGNQVQ
jgi:hypothetical protein